MTQMHATPDSSSTPQGASVHLVSGDLFGALEWLVAHFREEIAPYHASTNHDYPQTAEWRCHGCEGLFVSHWPKWEEPTDESFPHEQHCRYMKAVKLSQAKPNNTVSRDGA